MEICGLQKLTLLDWPGKVACTLFTAGCDLRCPFCHNPELVLPRRFPPAIPEQELLSFLDKRQGILEGVCVTGGEPTIHTDLPRLLKKLKDLGYAVKLDTNGRRPETVKALAAEGLIDYVAMDIKNSPERYAGTVGLPSLDLEPIRQTAAFLMEGSLPFEFRTTVVKPLHDVDSFRAIGKWLTGEEPYFLQPFVDSGDLLGSGLYTHAPQELADMLDVLRQYVPKAELRGE